MPADKATQAKQLKENPLWREILGAWRQDIIDAMLTEGDPGRRDTLWREQLYLLHLSERVESELDSILTGRESDD